MLFVIRRSSTTSIKPCLSWFPSYLSEIWKIKCSASTTNAVSFEASAAKKSKVVMRLPLQTLDAAAYYFIFWALRPQRLLDFVWRNRAARTCADADRSGLCVAKSHRVSVSWVSIYLLRIVRSRALMELRRLAISFASLALDVCAPSLLYLVRGALASIYITPWAINSSSRSRV